MIRTKDIRVNPANPRVIKGDRFEKLVQSLKEFPKMLKLRPIIVDGQGVILAGNMRYKALLSLGYKELPDEWVKRAEELTDEELRRFIIADNVGFGEHDWQELADNWDLGELESWGLEFPDNWASDEKETKEDEYEVPEEVETEIKLGDLIEIGHHRLLCGDSTDPEQVARLMNGEKADMVFTDPPYAIFGSSTGAGTNIADAKMVLPFFKATLNAVSSILDEFGHFYVCCDFRSYPHLVYTQPAFLGTKNLIVWHKIQGDGGLGSFYTNQHELIHFGERFTDIKAVKSRKAGKRTINGAGNVWAIPAETYGDKEEKLHAARKPLKVVERALVNSSDVGDLVTDLFLGSGSTMVAAHQLNRKCYGLEIDPKYCQVIVDRMLKLDPDLEIKLNGETWLL